MIRNFFKHLLESLKNLRRNSWMTVAAVSSVMITLILVGGFLSIILNTRQITEDITNNVRISAYMNLNVHDQQAKLQDPKDTHKTIENKNYRKIYNEIKGINHVEKITFSSKDQQLKDLTAALGDTWNLYQGDANPLYDVYVVEVDKPANVKTVAAEIAKVAGINKADYGGASSQKLFKINNLVQTWGLVIAVLLLLIAVFLISNTIRITIMSRQREIQIMRLVGAKNSYIRWPFFLEGAWVGLLGAIIPSLLVAWLYGLAFASFTPALHSSHLSMIHPNSFIPLIIVIMVVIGVLIGAFGSILSMRRFLKV
ncbi:permease-like cell division protein FtsX [Lactococcus termiticola]|uniref:Cell division protein FtsX n=1 Tax=Lactococcus termiticola TaxID=2169526 RepID=A0A2R5HJE3_9LACT|nr:permease-like cell division protein FtsX [Lactococcus termiticola]GBG96351.1 cell division protein FtsX [Lactococcus termiticola]